MGGRGGLPTDAHGGTIARDTSVRDGEVVGLGGPKEVSHQSLGSRSLLIGSLASLPPTRTLLVQDQVLVSALVLALVPVVPRTKTSVLNTLP